MEHSFSGVAEGITEATLSFGLLPNNQLSVIGVSWTLGIIFLFYMLFPFFVFLCYNKRRALFSLIVSLMLSEFCVIYFFDTQFVVEGFQERHNFLYCAPFFLGGGCTFLFRDEIKKIISKNKWISITVCIALTVAWYIIPNTFNGISILMFKNMILFLVWLWYAVSVDSKVLNNRVMKYISGISLELYLAQMIVFRAIEKVHGLYLFGSGWLSFAASWLMVVLGLILFIECYKKAAAVIQKRFKKICK